MIQTESKLAHNQRSMPIDGKHHRLQPTAIIKFKTVCLKDIKQSNNQTFRSIYQNLAGSYSLFNIEYAYIIGKII